MIKQYPALH